MKQLIVFNLIVFGLSIIISVQFPDLVSYWLMVTAFVFSVISFLSHYLYILLKAGENIMAPFFLSMIIRFLAVGIITLFYVKTRNIESVPYVSLLFIIYLLHLGFELKYILHNLRAN